MNKVWVFFVGLIMTVSGALANQPVMVKFGSDEGWKVFEAELVSLGYMKSGDTSFDTKGITAVMMNGLSPEAQKVVGFDRLHTANLEQHKIGQRIEVGQFRKMASSGMFFMPRVYANAPTSQAVDAVPTETPVAADPVAIGTAIKEGREALSAMPPSPEVEELRKKLSELATKKADAVLLKDLTPLVPQVTAVKAEIKALTLRIKAVEDGVTAINRRLNDEKSGLAMAHTKADAAHARLNDEKNGLAAAHAKAERAQSGVDSLGKRLDAVEGQVGSGVWQWVAIGASALLALIALLRTFRKGKSDKKAVDQTVGTGEADASGMEDNVLDFKSQPRFTSGIKPGGGPFVPKSV